MVDEQNMTAQWKYIIPIEKADFGDRWVISGVVTGPGYVDAAGDEFLPEAIDKMVDYINQNPLPLLDWHGKNYVNTIVAPEMGEVFKAYKDDAGLLWIDAELDKTNPAAQWLKGKMDNPQRPRKFGLSVHGFAVNPRASLSGGRIKRQIADLIPDEISLTTRPFFQPSLGTVISKAIDEATAESVAGDKSSMSDEVTPQAVEEVAAEVAPEQAGVDAASDSETVADVAASTDEVAVEKSETPSAEDVLRGLILNIVRQEIGNSKVEPVVPSVPETPAEVTVEKSEPVQPDRLAAIEKALSDLGVTVERLLENTPEISAPGVLVAKSQEDEARQAFAEMSPSQRIRAGFQMSEQKLR